MVSLSSTDPVRQTSGQYLGKQKKWFTTLRYFLSLGLSEAGSRTDETYSVPLEEKAKYTGLSTDAGLAVRRVRGMSIRASLYTEWLIGFESNRNSYLQICKGLRKGMKPVSRRSTRGLLLRLNGPKLGETRRPNARYEVSSGAPWLRSLARFFSAKTQTLTPNPHCPSILSRAQLIQHRSAAHEASTSLPFNDDRRPRQAQRPPAGKPRTA